MKFVYSDLPFNHHHHQLFPSSYGVAVFDKSPPFPCSAYLSLDIAFSLKAPSKQSVHLLFCRPLLLQPSTSICITLLTTQSSSFLIICPYHWSLLSWAFLDISATLVVPQIRSYLILSILVIPHIHLNILISATSSLCP